MKPRNPKAGLLINLVNVHLRDFGQARFQPARASAGVTRLIDVLDVTAKGAEADIFFNVLMDCAGVRVSSSLPMSARRKRSCTIASQHYRLCP